METISTARTVVWIQWIITGILALILVSLVGGYIYYGMKQAQTEIVIETGVPDPLPVATEPATEGFSREDKLKILESLAGADTPSVTPEEKADILSNLTQTEKPRMTEDEKRALLLQASAVTQAPFME